jgi:hypothetical protein
LVDTCSAHDGEAQPTEARNAAARLLGGGVQSIEPLGGGRNSRVYRVLGADGRSYALKAYFRHPADPRDRRKT